MEGCPYWVAYENKSNGAVISRFNPAEDLTDDNDILEYAWLQFEELIQDFPYGKIKVVCRTSSNSQKQHAPTFLVEWGELPVGGTYNKPTTNSIGGGQGAGGSSWQMMQFFITQMDQLRSEISTAQLENVRLNMENQQMAAQLEADMEPTFKEKALMEGIGAIKTLITQPRQQPQPAALGTLGQAPPQEMEQPTQQTNGGGFSMDRAIASIQGLKTLFPDHHPNDILEALVILGQKNHALVKGQIDQAIAELHA